MAEASNEFAAIFTTLGYAGLIAWADRALVRSTNRNERAPRGCQKGCVSSRIAVRRALSCCSFGCDDEVGEIGRLMRGAFRPEDEELASILSGVRAVYLAGLEMQRSAGLVLFALVDEVALNHIERLGHPLVDMCRNSRAGCQRATLPALACSPRCGPPA